MHAEHSTYGSWVAVQILDNRAYIVGESPGFQYLNLRNKQMLASVLEAFPGTLPDVDFVIQGSDWIPPSLNDTGRHCKLNRRPLTINSFNLHAFEKSARCTRLFGSSKLRCLLLPSQSTAGTIQNSPPLYSDLST